MGIIPTPITSTEHCALCYAINETPDNVKCIFSGIQRGALWAPVMGMPPNGYWDINNDHVFPCLWTRGAPPWPQIRFLLQAGRSDLACKPTFLATAFHGTRLEDCKYHFTNLAVAPAGNAFYGGHGYVVSAMSMGQSVESFTPMIDPNPRMDCFAMADEEIVIRYAGKRDATRIHIKFDTNP